MNRFLVSLLAALLATTVMACASSSSKMSEDSSSNATAAGGTAVSVHRKKDRDNDEDNNDDDYHVLAFGHVANPADSEAITQLIQRYLAAAAAAEGAKACSLLAPFIAEVVVERDGHTAGLRGNSCAAVMTKLFKQSHAELIGKSIHLKVMRIGVEANRARVALEFPEIPVVHQITARRIDGKWTILDLLDHTIE